MGGWRENRSTCTFTKAGSSIDNWAIADRFEIHQNLLGKLYTRLSWQLDPKFRPHLYLYPRVRVNDLRPVLLTHPSFDIPRPRFEAEVLRLINTRLTSGVSELRSVYDTVGLFALGRESLVYFFHSHLPMHGWLPSGL
jgi:hypothetical protein